MGISGDLDTFGLADVFQTLSQNQQTGTLRVHDAQTEKYIFFSQGLIRSVSSGRRRNVPLGELLVAWGRITEDQLGQALSRQETNDDVLLGQALVELGACSQEDIDQTLRFQMEEEIYGLFTWRGAQFEFYEGPMQTTIFGKRHRVSEIHINTAALVMEAARRVDEWGRIQAVLPSMKALVKPAGDAAKAIVPEDATAEEQRILSLVDGINSVQAIVRKSMLGQYTVTQCLAKHINAGLLRLGDAAEMRRAGEKALVVGEPEVAVDLYSLLAETEGETPDVLKRLASAQEGAGQLEDAAATQRKLGKHLAGGGDFPRAIQAYEHAGRLTTLTGEDMDHLAELYLVTDRGRDAASMWLTRVRTLMDRKDHARARELCDRAIENVPESTELRSLKARVCLEEDDQQAAIQAYEALAALYERQGNLQAAISTYRNIVHLDASRVDLRQRIRSMQERSQQKKKETQYRLAGYAALAVCILIFVGGIGLEVRARMRLTEREESLQKTLDQAREADSPRVRLELLKEEAAKWRTYQAGPSITDLSFRAETNQNRVKEALRLAKQEIESIHDTVRNRDLDALERAEALLASGEEQSRGEALGILRRLSERTPPSDITERAQARLNQALAARTEANALYERLQTEALPVEERFELARRLVEEFPNTVYSHSVRLPVRLRVTPALNARVRLGGVPAGRISPQQPEVLLEVPPFEPFTVSIIRPGFGNEEGVTTWTDTKYRRPTKEVTLQRTVRWRRERLLAGRVEGAPALAPDGPGSPVLVVASSGGDVIGLDLAAGTTRWEFAGAEETLSFQATPFVDDGTVLLPDSTGRILRIRASDGERLSPKREPLDTALTGAALFTRLDFYGGRLCCVAGTQEGAVVCLDVERNRMVWHKPYQTGVVDPIGQQAAHVGDFLYITTPDGKLHTLRGDGQAESVRQVTRGFLAGPTSDADGFYTVSAEGRLAAWQARREPVQRWQSPPICPPHTVAAPVLLRDRIVFVGTDQGCVAAASAEGGKILWRNHEIPAGLTGPLHHTGDELLAPAGKTVISLDPALGTERWRLTASSGPVKGITSSRNHIAFVDQRGSVYVLDKDRDPE